MSPYKKIKEVFTTNKNRSRLFLFLDLSEIETKLQFWQWMI
jgi:hypothetical protein